jgi:hypothetical protein
MIDMSREHPYGWSVSRQLIIAVIEQAVENTGDKAHELSLRANLVMVFDENGALLLGPHSPDTATARENAVFGSRRRIAPPKAPLARRLDRVGPFVAELGVAPVFYSLCGPLDLRDPEL